MNKTHQLLQKYGPWALVTGASSGIGAEFARALARYGFNLVIVARRVERLNRLAEELSAQHAVQVKVVPADLSEVEFLPRLRTAIEGLEIGLLVNNAGFALVSHFLDNDLERELELLHVNVRAALMLTHELGRKMRQQHRGGIIFISSNSSLVPSPPWSTYVASKAYERYLAECLAEELVKDGVDVLAVCSGGVETEFQQVARADSHNGGLLLRLAVTQLKPAAVVRDALAALGKKVVVVPGWRNRLFVFLASLLPRRIAIHITAQVMEKFIKEN